jgi:hypothetical protein
VILAQMDTIGKKFGIEGVIEMGYEQAGSRGLS